MPGGAKRRRKGAKKGKQKAKTNIIPSNALCPAQAPGTSAAASLGSLPPKVKEEDGNMSDVSDASTIPEAMDTYDGFCVSEPPVVQSQKQHSEQSNESDSITRQSAKEKNDRSPVIANFESGDQVDRSESPVPSSLFSSIKTEQPSELPNGNDPITSHSAREENGRSPAIDNFVSGVHESEPPEPSSAVGSIKTEQPSELPNGSGAITSHSVSEENGRSPAISELESQSRNQAVDDSDSDDSVIFIPVEKPPSMVVDILDDDAQSSEFHLDFKPVHIKTERMDVGDESAAAVESAPKEKVPKGGQHADITKTRVKQEPSDHAQPEPVSATPPQPVSAQNKQDVTRTARVPERNSSASKEVAEKSACGKEVRVTTSKSRVSHTGERFSSHPLLKYLNLNTIIKQSDLKSCLNYLSRHEPANNRFDMFFQTFEKLSVDENSAERAPVVTTELNPAREVTSLDSQPVNNIPTQKTKIKLEKDEREVSSGVAERAIQEPGVKLVHTPPSEGPVSKEPVSMECISNEPIPTDPVPEEPHPKNVVLPQLHLAKNNIAEPVTVAAKFAPETLIAQLPSKETLQEILLQTAVAGHESAEQMAIPIPANNGLQNLSTNAEDFNRKRMLSVSENNVVAKKLKTDDPSTIPLARTITSPQAISSPNALLPNSTSPVTLANLLVSYPLGYQETAHSQFQVENYPGSLPCASASSSTGSHSLGTMPQPVPHVSSQPNALPANSASPIAFPSISHPVSYSFGRQETAAVAMDVENYHEHPTNSNAFGTILQQNSPHILRNNTLNPMVFASSNLPASTGSHALGTILEQISPNMLHSNSPNPIAFAPSNLPASTSIHALGNILQQNSTNMLHNNTRNPLVSASSNLPASHALGNVLQQNSANMLHNNTLNPTAIAPSNLPASTSSHVLANILQQNSSNMLPSNSQSPTTFAAANVPPSYPVAHRETVVPSENYQRSLPRANAPSNDPRLLAKHSNAVQQRADPRVSSKISNALPQERRTSTDRPLPRPQSLVPGRIGSKASLTQYPYESIGKTFVTGDMLQHLLLQWNPDWLRHQKETGQCPPICEAYPRVRRAYDDPLQYYNTYLPLHVLSIWLRVYDAWGVAPPPRRCLLDTTAGSKEGFTDVVCEDEFKGEEGWPRRDHFVLCRTSRAEFFAIVKNVGMRRRQHEGSTVYRLRTELRCPADLDLADNSAMDLQLLFNLRISLMQCEALEHPNAELRPLLLDPSAYGRRVVSVDCRLGADGDLRRLRDRIRDAVARPEHQAVLVDTTGIKDVASLIVLVTYLLTKEDFVLFLCFKSERLFREVTHRLRPYDPLVLVRTKEMRGMGEELTSLTLEAALQGGQLRASQVVRSRRILITTFSSFAPRESGLASAFNSSSRQVVCLVDEADVCLEVETALPLRYPRVGKLLLMGRQGRQAAVPPLLTSHCYQVPLFMRLKGTGS